MKCIILSILALSVLCGCTQTRAKLGTLKNPYPVMVQPSSITTGVGGPINPFVESNYRILLKAVQFNYKDKSITLKSEKNVPREEMKQYLDAGFALSDIYCAHYFRDAEESRRRRQFSRSLTNDTGTAISTILSLANAGQNIVGGSAAFFGLADKSWRSYDDAFVVAPDLSQVRELVLNAQDVFRKKTMDDTGNDAKAAFPTSYAKAQSVIQRYADICSTLGMRALLNSATADKTLDLQAKIVAPAAAAPPVAAGGTVPAAAGSGATGGTPASSTTGPTDISNSRPQGIPQAIPG